MSWIKTIALVFAVFLLIFAALASHRESASFLIIEGKSSQSGFSALYADRGNGLKQIMTSGNFYWQSETVVQHVFPVDLKHVEFLRFDPVAFASESGFRAEISKVSWHSGFMGRSQVVELGPGSLVPLNGVFVEAGEGTLVLDVEPGFPDPQLMVQVPSLIRSGAHSAQRKPWLVMFASGVLFLIVALGISGSGVGRKDACVDL